MQVLLVAGTILALPILVPLLVIHSGWMALVVAAPMGLAGGLADAAGIDLIIRSCPKGFEGSVFAGVSGLAAIVGQSSNLLGTSLFERYLKFPWLSR